MQLNTYRASSMCRTAIALQFNTPTPLCTLLSRRAVAHLLAHTLTQSAAAVVVRCKRDLVNTPRVHGKLINIFVHLMACSA